MERREGGEGGREGGRGGSFEAGRQSTEKLRRVRGEDGGRAGGREGGRGVWVGEGREEGDEGPHERQAAELEGGKEGGFL